MKVLITKRAIDALEPRAKKYPANDTKITGFMVIVSPTGAKSFVYRYRFPRGRAGRVRDYTIGRHGAITVDQAREEAEKLQGDYKIALDLVSPLQAFDQGGRARAFATMIEGLSNAKAAGLTPEAVKAALAFIDEGQTER